MAPSLVQKINNFTQICLSGHIFRSEYAINFALALFCSAIKAERAFRKLLKSLQHIRSYNLCLISALNNTAYSQEMFRVTYTLRENKFVQSRMDFRYAGDWTDLRLKKKKKSNNEWA